MTNFPKFCTEIDAFHSRCGINFSHTDHILQSRAITRVLNLYADLRSLHSWEADPNRHIYLRLCEQMIEDWQVWVNDGQPRKDNPFETVGYKELKEKIGW